MLTIKTENGEVELVGVYCEVTGKLIGWQSVMSDGAIEKGCTPAYLSFDVVSKKGKQRIDITDINTF